jgi:hypothetical protein
MTIIKTSELQFSASPLVCFTIVTGFYTPLTRNDASDQSPAFRTVSPVLDCLCEEPVELAMKLIERGLQQPPDFARHKASLESLPREAQR